jgi:hypothetical protein
MSDEGNSARVKQWNSDVLRDAVRKEQVTKKENVNGKADCWKKFRLAVDEDESVTFCWAVCNDCNCCIMYKTKSEDGSGSVKLYRTTNMVDHMKSCYSSHGKQLTMGSFVKRVPGKNFAKTEKDAVKEAEIRLVIRGGVSFSFFKNSDLLSFAQLMIETMVMLM